MDTRSGIVDDTDSSSLSGQVKPFDFALGWGVWSIWWFALGFALSTMSFFF
jgi:hypothetical protein